MTHVLKGSVVEGSVIECSVELEKAWGPPTSNRRPPPRRIAKVCKSPIAVVRAAFKPMATGTELRGLRCVDRLRRRSCSWRAGSSQRYWTLSGRAQFDRRLLRGSAGTRPHEFEGARSIRCNRRGTWRRVGRALAIAVPVVVLLFILLVSGDALFAATFDIDLSVGLGHVALTAIGLFVFAVPLTMATRPSRVRSVTRHPQLRSLDAAMLLGGVAALFAVYAAVQLSGLLSGAKYVEGDWMAVTASALAAVAVLTMNFVNTAGWRSTRPTKQQSVRSKTYAVERSRRQRVALSANSSARSMTDTASVGVTSKHACDRMKPAASGPISSPYFLM